MKIKTKVASSNVVCVFGDFEGVQVHLANIDFRNNRMYTNRDGFDIIATNQFLENHSLAYFEEEDANGNKINLPFSKFNACVDFKTEEISSILKMCNR